MREKRLKYHGNAIRELKKRVLPSTIFSKKKSGAGFTFIEMLVVVTLIGILSLIGVANFRVANQKARDGRRQGDLQQIRAALELYRTDENEYPDANIIFDDEIVSPTTTYMEDIPSDPLDPTYTYYYSSDGVTYTLCAALELDTTGNCGGYSCGTGITCNYKITNPL